MICVPALCATECAGLAGRTFVLWHTLAGGHPFRRQLLVNTLASAPVLLQPRMGPTLEHSIHQPNQGDGGWATNCSNKVCLAMH